MQAGTLALQSAPRFYDAHFFAKIKNCVTSVIGKAIERCRNKINDILQESATGKPLFLSDVKEALALQISGAVANSNGHEYDGYYPTTGSLLVFGAQAIDVNDGAKYLIEESKLNNLLV